MTKRRPRKDERQLKRAGGHHRLCVAEVVPREIERRVIALVREILDAQLLTTPEWLLRPGRTDCKGAWPLVQTIYSDLTALELPEVMRAIERRTVDAVLERVGEPPRILEVDEKQHFNAYRARTLRHYIAKVPLAFDADIWIERSQAKKRLEGGGFGAPKPPLFPGDGGRHRQRAFRDALCDILPLQHGWQPTLRVADFEVADWIFTSDARRRLEELLRSRLPSLVPSQ
jgi:hypothetical protein